jgi:hypothetical protein
MSEARPVRRRMLAEESEPEPAAVRWPEFALIEPNQAAQAEWHSRRSPPTRRGVGNVRADY